MTLTASAPTRARRGPLRGVTGRLATMAGPVMAAIAVQSLANLVLHAALGRTLPPSDYGALGAVLAAMTLVAVPLTALQTSAARLVASAGLTGRTGRAAMARALRLLAPVVLLLVLLAAPVAGFLHLGSWWDAALLAPTVLVSGLLATARGVLLGTGRSGTVAGSYLVATLVRLGLALLLAVPLGVTGALLGTALGEAVALMHAGRAAWPASPGPTHRLSIGDVAGTTAVVTGLFAFTTIDLFLARHFLPGATSGAYVAAATIGKTILALPAAAMSVAYPRLVASWTSRSGLRPALRSSLVVVGLPAMAGAILVCLLPGLVLSVLYGAAFGAGTQDLVRALALIAGSSALVSVLAHAALARGSRTALLPWAAAALQVVAISSWHSTAMSVALASAASLVLALVLLGLTEVHHWRAADRADAAGAKPAGTLHRA